MRSRLLFGFAMLCLLSGSGWLVTQWSPGVLSGAEEVCLHAGLLALFFGGVSFARGEAGGGWRVSGLALLFVGVPQLASGVASGPVADLTELLISVTLPAFAVFFLTQGAVGFGEDEGTMGLLVPALTGLGGAALLLPFYWPASPAGRVWLMALAGAYGVSAWAAIRLYERVGRMSVSWIAAVLSGAVFLGSLPLCRPARFSGLNWTVQTLGSEVVQLVLFDLPGTVLLAWLLGRMAPAALAARYFLIPATTVLETMLVVRPEVHWTAFAGLVLLGGASIPLLHTQASELPSVFRPGSPRDE